MRKIWLVAQFALKEAARRRALLVLMVGALVVVVGFGFGFKNMWQDTVGRLPPTQAEAMAWTGIRMVMGLLNILVSIAAVFVGATGIHAEIENGSLHVLLPRTVTRLQVFLGKLLAVTLLVGGFSLLLALGIGLSAVAAGPGWPPGWHWVIIGFGIPPVLLAAVSLALSTRLPTLASGLISLMLFVAAQIGSVLEMMAANLKNDALNVSAIIVSLVTPMDAMYRWMLDQWSGAMGPAAAIFRVVDGINAPPPSAWMLLWSAGWLAAITAAGIQSFRSRDL